MTIDKTLSERGGRYGDFTDHAKIAQEIQDAMRKAPGWNRLNAVQKQALTVIADKQARILSGDPNYHDNWHDIQGYAKLVEDRLPPVAPAPANDNLVKCYLEGAPVCIQCKRAGHCIAGDDLASLTPSM